MKSYQLEITGWEVRLTGSVSMKIGYRIYKDDGEGVEKIHNVQ